MKTLLPLLALVLGFVLNEISQGWRNRRDRLNRRVDRRDEFIAGALGEALAALDDAYEAAAAIGLHADKLGANGVVDTADEWAIREPYVTACGRASFRLRRVAALLPDATPRRELEAVAQATANMTGEGTTKELLTRWDEVEPVVVVAREAVGTELRSLYEGAAGPEAIARE